jgi:F-type H+-transporting ATPase subunit b
MRRYLGYILLLAAFALLLAAPAVFAADEKTHGAPNPMEFRYDTALWALVVFVGLATVLYFKAWGPILEGLKKREDTIRSSLEEAKLTRNEMARIQTQFQKELADAHQQIPKLLEEARKDAEVLSAEMRAKAVADIAVERERLRREVEIAKDQAIKELWEQAAQLATLISTKAIGRALTEDDHRRLLDEALTEMRQAERI